MKNMKPHQFIILLLAGCLVAGIATPGFAQSEQVKKRAKDLKKKVEDASAVKTNTPPVRPVR